MKRYIASYLSLSVYGFYSGPGWLLRVRFSPIPGILDRRPTDQIHPIRLLLILFAMQNTRIERSKQQHQYEETK